MSINLVSSFLRITNKHYNWMNKMAIANGMMPLSLRWTKSMNIKSFRTMGKPNMILSREKEQMHQMDSRKSGSTSSLLSNMMADTRLDWLLEDISLQILFHQRKVRNTEIVETHLLGPQYLKMTSLTFLKVI